MAGLAIQRDMRAGQRIAGARVIPIGGVPGRCRMAGLAFSVESRLRMARIHLGIVGLLVTSNARGRRVDVTAGMTGNALQARVRSG